MADIAVRCLPTVSMDSAHMYVDDYVTAKRPIGYWRELLREWVFLVHRVYRVSARTTSVYAEKERANTGLLAAAATRNGWVALEECRTKKVEKKSRRVTYSGRCDLVLWRDRRHHEIEAKFARTLLTSSNISRVRRAVERSIADSRRSTESGYSSEKKIAVTYIVPTIYPGRLEDMVDDEISTHLELLIERIKTEFQPTFMAYAFPGEVTLEGSPHYGLGAIVIGSVTG
jgi:hypothetical protein|tara:strand:- start:34 stop:720 length:687 start_codon:yes stop_codon:yes gene_type:complete